MRDIEVTIKPSGRGSLPGTSDLSIRTVYESGSSHAWTRSELTEDNLRKIADKIYAHLGMSASMRLTEIVPPNGALHFKHCVICGSLIEAVNHLGHTVGDPELHIRKHREEGDIT